ncbi:hypothetical protein QE152_g40906, partial [Popillia japonica]
MDIDNISANALHHFTESVAEPVVSTYNINELPIIFESDNLEVGNATSSIENNIIENGGQTENDNFDIASCRSMIWKKKENIFDMDKILDKSKFQGNSTLPESILNLSSPSSFFKYFFSMCIYNFIITHRSLCRYFFDENLLNEIVEQTTFRYEIAETLCRAGIPTGPKRGRPSSSLNHELEAKKRKANAAIIPSQGIRTDETSHWPVYND